MLSIVGASRQATQRWVTAAATRTNLQLQPQQCQCLCQRRLVHVEKRIEELGIELPKAAAPRANYNIVCRASGNMLYVSGHIPFKTDGTLMTGRIGPEGSNENQIEHGVEAARNCGLNIVATLKEHLGDLDQIEQIVKVRPLATEPSTCNGGIEDMVQLFSL